MNLVNYFNLSKCGGGKVVSKKFIKGIKYEIANRAFALDSIGRISDRVKGRPEYTFWKSYEKLEKFSAPKYAKFAEKIGLNSTPSFYTKAKAWSTSIIPIPLIDPTIKLLCFLTKIYLKDLKKLRDLGRKEDIDFLNYMVAQEELQIELMELAILKRYVRIIDKVDDFIIRNSDKN
ncbi:hypothetical protein [Acinetobacter seifertii]|uniref:hypothetical protein n=1 Tax=Acinetobacter seifertii TaxID=1530123 RepID=UPI001D18FC91|nr:hypothetical protein [Acinetobacter seifertii]